MYKKTRVRVVILCSGIQGKPVGKPHGNKPWGFILAVEHCRGTILKPLCVPYSLLYCLCYVQLLHAPALNVDPG